MSVATNVKKTYQKVGTAITILRDSGNISGEYCHWAPNAQVTKPFILEYFKDGALGYDTQVLAGDVVEFDVTGEKHMVMNRNPRLFKNVVIQYSCVLYKCNVSGELSRPSEVADGWDSDYEKATGFDLVKGDCYGLLTEALYGHDLESDEELGQIGIENNELYMPSSFGPSLLDRYQAASGEYYKVETIKRRRYASVYVLSVGEDTR